VERENLKILRQEEAWEEPDGDLGWSGGGGGGVI